MKKLLLLLMFVLLQTGCSINKGVLENYKENNELHGVAIVDCENPVLQHVNLFFTKEEELEEFIYNMNRIGYYLVAESIWYGKFENDIDKQSLELAKKNKICYVTYDTKITRAVNTTIPVTNYHTDYYGNTYTTTSYMPTTLYGAEHIVLFWKKYDENKNEIDVLQKDAETGIAEAQERLGYLYYMGEEGAIQDYNKAKYWLELASEENRKDANFFLADMYFSGKGVSQDYEKARNLFEKSAKEGSAWACGMLGLIYENGKGVPSNIIQARYWYNEMCQRGEQKGCEEYARLNKQGD